MSIVSRLVWTSALTDSVGFCVYGNEVKVQEEWAKSELVLPSGRVVLMEAPFDAAAARDVGLGGKIPLAEVLSDLQELCSLLLETTRAISPAEAEIELSVGVEAGTGRLMAFMVDGKASGGLKLRLKWAGQS